MRLPLPFLLYVTALGLFGWAGWTVYESLPLWKAETRKARSSDGIEIGGNLITEGKGTGPAIVDWNYGQPNWWPQFLQVNLIGKLPPKKKTQAEIDEEKAAEEPKVDLTPLEDIIELVSLVYDGKGDGRGENSHVIIRYKPEANVQPPEWWEKENAPPTANRRGGPGDVSRLRTAKTTPNRNGRNGRNGRNNRGLKPATTKLPTAGGSSTAGRTIMQKLWVDDGGNVRRSSSLWPTYGNIKLVRVAPDAQSAFFVRVIPPKDDGEVVEPKEEELVKTTMDLSQDVLKELRRLQGREGERTGPTASAPAAQKNKWRDVENTTRFGNEFHIGRKDERRFRDGDDFFNNVSVDTYVSKSSKLRGLSVRSVQPEVAQRFGVQTGDVLLEVNGRKVESKAQAFSQVKKDYKRGVRAFNTKWLSNGQVVDRLYQAPDR